MPKAKKQTKKDSSWRNIKQTSSNRGSTPIAKWRRIRLGLRHSLWLFAGLCIIILLALVYPFWQKKAPLKNQFSGKPIRNVYFHTDGVLEPYWLEELMDFDEQNYLMDVDIVALREQLLENDQIEDVEIKRVFPDSLSINIKEQRPIMRIAVAAPDGAKHIYLVSDLGEVYQGYNYPADTLRQLPYLSGVVLQQSQEGFAMIPQVPIIAHLLESARLEEPDLYADWWLVSCKDFSGDADEVGASILVDTRNMGQLIFAPREFSLQLGRLNSILRYASQHQLRHLKSIDLTLEEPVLKLASGQSKRRYRR